MTVTPDLSQLYQPPSERILKAERDHLVPVHREYLKVATFFCFATGTADGLDASPRGGPPGFVHVLDDRTVAFADWPGNNRIASMRNLQRDDRAAMLFLFPGLEVFLRIGGRARLSVDADLLDRLTEGGRRPKAATVLQVARVLFHCGKAVNRARLWDPAARIDRSTVPSVGTVLVALTELGEADVAGIDAHYDHAVRHDLY